MRIMRLQWAVTYSRPFWMVTESEDGRYCSAITTFREFETAHLYVWERLKQLERVKQ